MMSDCADNSNDCFVVVETVGTSMVRGTGCLYLFSNYGIVVVGCTSYNTSPK